VVITGHILAAALDYLKISSLDDIPPDHIVPSAQTLQAKTREERKEVLKSISKGIVTNNMIFISMNKMSMVIKMKILSEIVIMMRCMPIASIF